MLGETMFSIQDFAAAFRGELGIACATSRGLIGPHASDEEGSQAGDESYVHRSLKFAVSPRFRGSR
jgi:hypothetical protein